MKLATLAFGLIIALGVHGQQAVNTKKLSIKISNIQSKGRYFMLEFIAQKTDFQNLISTGKTQK